VDVDLLVNGNPKTMEGQCHATGRGYSRPRFGTIARYLVPLTEDGKDAWVNTKSHQRDTTSLLAGKWIQSVSQRFQTEATGMIRGFFLQLTNPNQTKEREKKTAVPNQPK